jgi:hypothetical protein
MACSDYQTECLKVVTIGYLKSFIGNLVQNSTNGNPISIQRTDDTYCPTYSELTGGTIIQTWLQSSTSPKSDRDGITVNSTWAGGSSGYSANQLVDQRDLGLKYTRFRTLSISRSGSGEISECGGSATLTYTYNHTRYTKSMNNNSCVTSTSSSNVNSPCGELTYHTTYGSVSNCTSYSIGKNGSFSANPRTDNVYATTTFRGTTRTSNSVDIPQKALTGSYSREKSRWEETTSVTATATSQTTFDCVGGPYSARGTRKYNIVGRFAWVDSCNVEYSQTQDRNISTNQTEDLGTQSGSFGYHDCCEGSYSTSANIQFSKGGKSSPTITFTQSCSDCSSDPSCSSPTCDGVEYTIYPDKQIGCGGGSVTFTFEGGCKCSLLNITTTSMSFAEDGETKTASFTLAAACGLDWTKPSWITITESRDDDGTGTLSCVASANDTGSQRTGTIKLKVSDSECHSISVSQDGEAPVDCPESGGTSDWTGVVFIGDHQIDGDANDEVGMLAFKTGDTAFSSVKSLTCDGTVVTAATWTTEGGETPPGWKRITVSHGANPSTTETRNGSVTIVATKTDGDDCTYVVNLTQKAKSLPTSAVTISWSGLPGNLANGGLMVTGSTYTAEFILGGPKAGNGTLHGTLTADLRDAMTFSGQFTVQGSGGGSIENVCPGHQGEIYEVSTATWDYANKKLGVGFRKCS